MTFSPRPLEHPLLAVVRVVGEVLDETALVDPMYLSTQQKRELLVGLSRVVDRLQARRAAVLAVSGDVADQEAARSAGVWLAGEAHTSRRELAAVERVGVALGRRWTQTAEAVASGRVSWEQAGVLVRCLEALPADLDPELVVKAEAHLVGEAGHFGPAELARLGHRVLEVVAPDVADAAQVRALAQEERRAREMTRLSFRPRADGTTDVHARLPEPVASRLRVYLDGFTSPRRTGPAAGVGVGEVDLLPLSRRRGEAFCSLLEQLPADRLPTHGGTATAVMVTIDLEALRTGLGLGETSTGELVTAGEARRLACTAGVLPVVLGGAGEILDLGRARRLFSPAQRKAMAMRDRRCRAEGCDIPAAWCEAHHATRPWSQGGKTDLDDGLLLCSYHHHRAHDQHYDTRHLPNGDVRYTRRT